MRKSEKTRDYRQTPSGMTQQGIGNLYALLTAGCYWLCLLSVVLLTAGGCAVVGPDLQPPISPNLTASYSRVPAVANTVPLEAWWGSWADPKLRELINTASAQNLDAKQAYFRIVEARANVGVARGGLGPNIGLLSEYSFRKQSQNARPFVASNGQSFNLFLKGIDAAWQIDLFGKIRRTIEAAESQACFAEFDAQFIRQTLLSDTAGAYLRIRLLQDQLILVQQSLSIQEDTQKLVDERKEAGVSTELDSAQTESFIERSRTLMVALHQQLELEFNRLSLLLGEVPRQELREYLNDQSIVQMPPLPAIGFPADLIRNRPDVRRQEMTFVATLAEIGVAETDLYPQLSLTGTISVSAKNISDLFRTESLAFAVGPSFRWDIFQSGRIKCNIEAARARCEQAHLNYQQTVLSAVREVEDSIAQYNGFLQQSQTLTKAVSADERAVELSLERYKAGRANFQRTLDAQQQLLQDLQQRSSTQVQAIEQVVRLYNALGGNWNVGPCPTAGDGLMVAIPMQSQHLNSDAVGRSPVGDQTMKPDNSILTAPTSIAAPSPSPSQRGTDTGEGNDSPSPIPQESTDLQGETSQQLTPNLLPPTLTDEIANNPFLDFVPTQQAQNLASIEVELSNQRSRPLAGETLEIPRFEGPLPIVRQGTGFDHGGDVANGTISNNPFVIKTAASPLVVDVNVDRLGEQTKIESSETKPTTIGDTERTRPMATAKGWISNPTFHR